MEFLRPTGRSPPFTARNIPNQRCQLIGELVFSRGLEVDYDHATPHVVSIRRSTGLAELAQWSTGGTARITPRSPSKRRSGTAFSSAPRRPPARTAGWHSEQQPWPASRPSTAGASCRTASGSCCSPPRAPVLRPRRDAARIARRRQADRDRAPRDWETVSDPESAAFATTFRGALRAPAIECTEDSRVTQVLEPDK